MGLWASASGSDPGTCPGLRLTRAILDGSARGFAARVGTLLGLAGALLSSDLAAQRGPAVGAQVGYSRSDLAGADADLIQSRQGALTGVFLTFPIGGGISVRPELLFALKGGRAEAVAESGETALLDIDLAYLELPLLARVTLGRGRFRPVLFGGAAPAVQIGCDFQVDLPDVGQSGRITCGETDANFREWDFGIVAGAGFEVRWPKAALGLEARYTRGLQSVIEDIEVRNRMFGVLLALAF